MKNLILQLYLTTNPKKALYRFALNGRVLSSLDSLNLIESYVKKNTNELWAFSNRKNVAFFFCGTEQHVEGFITEDFIEVTDYSLNDLFCWMPHCLRAAIKKNQPDFEIYLDDQKTSYRELVPRFFRV